MAVDRVDFSTALGGDGQIVTNDADPVTGIQANYGHVTHFIRALGNMTKVAAFAAAKVATGQQSTSDALATLSAAIAEMKNANTALQDKVNKQLNDNTTAFSQLRNETLAARDQVLASAQMSDAEIKILCAEPKSLVSERNAQGVMTITATLMDNTVRKTTITQIDATRVNIVTQHANLPGGKITEVIEIIGGLPKIIYTRG